MSVSVLDPQNASCDVGQGGMCVSQLVSSIPDDKNVLNRKPDVNMKFRAGFHIFENIRETFNTGRYDRFLGM
jgi:hypothetical protein